MSTTTSARRAAAALTATAVALGTGLSLATGASASLPIDAESAAGLDEGTIERANGAYLIDGAVYVTAWDGHTSSLVYARPMTTGPEGTVVGDATLVGRNTPDGAITVHEGTVAFTRAVDGQLVLRAADGAQTLPAWGGHPGLAGGVAAMSDRWLVGWDEAYMGDPTLFDRTTGEAYGLAALVDLPVDYRYAEFGHVALTDSHVAFTVFSFLDAEATQTFSAAYVLELGDEGPQEPVTVLTESSALSPDDDYTGAGYVAFDDAHVVWTELQCAQAACENVLRWRDVTATEGDAEALDLGDAQFVGVDDGLVVLAEETAPSTLTLSWRDLDAPATPVTEREAGVGIDQLVQVRGSLLVWRLGDSVRPVLSDLDDNPVTVAFTHLSRVGWPFWDLTPYGTFTDEILWLYDRGIVRGHGNAAFWTTGPVTREAMAAFLYRAAHDMGTDVPQGGGGVLPDAPACEERPFVDVSTEHPFCGEIAWLAETGISTGWDDGTFRPGQAVTREAMAAFLYRLAEGGTAPSCTAAPFADVSTGHPFCGAIAWLAEAGISTGWPDDTFRPGLTIERQAMAAFLFRFIDGGHVPAA